MLKLENVTASYGAVQVLFGVSLTLEKGSVTTLLGKNGMGKSTTVRTIFGLTDAIGGSITFEGESLIHQKTHKIAQRGIALVPEGRQVFPTLDVIENLVATSRYRGAARRRAAVDEILNLFPRLAERRTSFSGLLSGGEQQMLAIGRALMTDPKLLILDEATEGLAPNIRREIWAALKRLKSEGMTILVIDKSLKPLCRIGDQHSILVKGKTAWTGLSAELEDPSSEARQLLAL
ncbi:MULTISPECIES: ABC transporter ATP-binding protein [Limibacillus]|jgi:branched-chain amino acid transport system ATP-binding protein|uniref:Branched-chain amino acid transport system ATP-binding protein n=1 Tax=Limibacillus halophilus TaxID=1579333 RepID=A0A839STG3_9PROT|nr:ABC transporter ATP-binding protein [Limibacillus halophilus]MBB3064275.1 branched-chain amino acid transport system ATP-binding protein [Limibacillus halophilus]